MKSLPQIEEIVLYDRATVDSATRGLDPGKSREDGIMGGAIGDNL